MKEIKSLISQNEGEKIIKTMHRHPLTFFRDAIGSIFLFFASLVVMIMFFYVPLVLPIAFLVFVFSIIGGFYSYFTWEKDMFLITNQRIVDIEQKTLFSKSQKEAYLEKIQDVSFEIKGILGSLFNYGTVSIQTASDSVLTLNDVASPESVQKIIFNIVKEESSKSQDDDGNLMKKMAEMIRRAIKEE